MYIVSEHGYGRPGYTVTNGQIWETGITGHEWRPISSHRAKGTAIKEAMAIPHHAVVIVKNSGELIFDNGKPPSKRVD